MHRAAWWLTLLLASLLRLPAQTTYSIDGTAGPPTDEETLYVEYINRARADPTAEGVRLRTTTDSEVVAAYTFFKTDLALMAQEFAAIPAAPPLAINGRLLNAARLHSKDQFDKQFQGHTGSNGSTIASRITAAGYNFQQVAENVYVTASSVFYGHAGFEVDWGTDAGGMQTGRGHRVNIHSPTLREVGAGVVLGTNGSVGPQVITQNFGTQQGATPLLTGVAYYDLTGDNFYSLGEGLGGIVVSVSGSTTSTTTSPSGAFTLPLPGNGTYTVRFSGQGIDSSGSVTVTNLQNVKLDLRRTYSAPVIAGTDAPPAGAASTYTFPATPGATRYELATYRRDSTTPAEAAEDTAKVTLATAAGYNVLQTAVRSQGTAAFNLRTVSGAGNQTITLNRTFFGRAGAAITFASRLTFASSAESARVQVSTDGGATWNDVFAQTGTGSLGDSAFVNQSRSLASYEGKVFQVRLALLFTSGSFFTGSGPLGWYVDDLKFPNCDELTAEPVRDLGSATTFNLTPSASTSYLLQVVVYNLARRLGVSEAKLATAAAPGAISTAGRIANMSIRTNAGTGDNTLIVGVGLGGSGTAGNKAVLIRGNGPSLAAYGVTGALADPVMTVFSGSTQIAQNDDWAGGFDFASVGAYAYGAGTVRDSAIYSTTTPSGTYSIQIVGKNNTTGVTLAEIYDATPASSFLATTPRLINVSARTTVGTGDNILIVGVGTTGSTPVRVLFRAAGPTLSGYGVAGVLADPKLELYNGATKLAENDNWAGTAELKAAFASVAAFAFASDTSRDAALVITLPPGATYTVQVSGVGATSGVALVEAYQLP